VSRHKSVDTLRGYVRDAEIFKDHAGAGLLQSLSPFPIMNLRSSFFPRRRRFRAARKSRGRLRCMLISRSPAISTNLCDGFPPATHQPRLCS
jgi:hypothetical protein